MQGAGMGVEPSLLGQTCCQHSPGSESHRHYCPPQLPLRALHSGTGPKVSQKIRRVKVGQSTTGEGSRGWSRPWGNGWGAPWGHTFSTIPTAQSWIYDQRTLHPCNRLMGPHTGCLTPSRTSPTEHTLPPMKEQRPRGDTLPKATSCGSQCHKSGCSSASPSPHFGWGNGSPSPP